MNNIFHVGHRGVTGKCTYCRCYYNKTTKDHLFPKTFGGKFTVECCLSCNQLKSDKTPTQWNDFIKKGRHHKRHFILKSMQILNKKYYIEYHNGVKCSLI